MNVPSYSLKRLIETPDLNQGFLLSFDEFKQHCEELGLDVRKTLQRIDPASEIEDGHAYSRFADAPKKELLRHFESELYVSAKRMRDLRQSEQETELDSALSIYAYELKVPYLQGEYRILQVSDIHFQKGNKKRISDLSTLVGSVKVPPDVVVCTGDIVDERHEDLDAEALDVLSRMFPYSKKLFVLGNHDYKEESDEIVKEKMRQAGWKYITDRFYRTKAGANSRVNIYGLGMPGFHESKIPSMKNMEKDTNIILTHSLDALHSGFPGCWDLVLSGHLHAGELDLWFFDGVDFLMKLGDYSNLNDQKKGWKALSRRTLSYISPGLATHSLIRFNTDKAGLTLITLKGE